MERSVLACSAHCVFLHSAFFVKSKWGNSLYCLLSFFLLLSTFITTNQLSSCVLCCAVHNVNKIIFFRNVFVFLQQSLSVCMTMYDHNDNNNCCNNNNNNNYTISTATAITKVELSSTRAFFCYVCCYCSYGGVR